ncbi:transcriptional regulator [Deinococcus indicus]|uniref:XRE family transcriptional regulator n=1 Tax=Deinococcus TaxID=1298 RepID=UPI00174B3321|nr:XRE family transcriptional regulator [Deinococcus indicus]GHG21334.1 transcriptional regulator [Deinococcus indicus]
MPKRTTEPQSLPPGTKLYLLLQEKNLKQTQLASLMGRSPQYIQDIIKGKKAMDARVAVELEEALGAPTAHEWLSWELDYQRGLMADEQSLRGTSGKKRRDIINEFPFAPEIIKRGWVEDSLDAEVLERNISAFINERPHTATGSYRVSGALATAKNSLDAWTTGCFVEAARKSIKGFAREKIATHLVPELQKLMATEGDVVHVPGTLEKYGIQLLLVPSLKKVPVDGVSADNAGHPFIALTLRHGQIDRFWFVLMHELAHLHHNHQPGQIEYSSFDRPVISTPAEAEADQTATEWLLDQGQLNDFIFNSVAMTLPEIEQFAEEVKRHRAIIIGRLKKEGFLPWSKYAREHVSVRDELSKAFSI